MLINTELLELQCKLLEKDTFEESLFQDMMAHPAMAAFMEHERMLNRKTTEETVRSSCEKAIGGVEETLLMQCKVRNNAGWLLETAISISRDHLSYEQQVKARIGRFSESTFENDTVVYLYAIGGDGGFSPGEGELYINLLKAKDQWMDILCHELYHARKLDEDCIEKRVAYVSLTEETDCYGDMLLSELAEEGIATLIQYQGNPRYDDAMVQGYLERINRWKVLTVEERQCLYQELSVGPQRYAVGVFLAEDVWNNHGRTGLDSWSMDGSLDLFWETVQEIR